MSNLKPSVQKGAVSLFVVIFTTLLIMVIVIGFVKLMVAGQQQASDSDLSQSAYDSAMAGVEDAKRALLVYSLCNTSDPKCSTLKTALNSDDCDTLAQAGVAGSHGSDETPIQKEGSGGEANDLNQAYTCVTVNMKTPNYQAEIDLNASRLIPLKGVSNFNKVKISWFTQADASGGALGGGTPPAVSFPTTSTGPVALPQMGSWGNPTTPAMLRFQLMQYGSDFKLSDFDSDSAASDGDPADASTVFLYPTNIGTDFKMNQYDSHGSTNAPAPVHCNATFGADTYACSVTITLPAVLGGGERQAYLWLSALYNQAHVSLELYNGADRVDFDGVQPEIDSTGRANDLFRRVKARVELTPADLPYPQAAVDLTGNLCKNFFITDDASDYASECSP